jgi:hypothetical protein
MRGMVVGRWGLTAPAIPPSGAAKLPQTAIIVAAVEHGGGIGIPDFVKSTGRSARQRNPCVPTPLSPTYPCSRSAKVPLWAAFANVLIIGPWPGLGVVDEAQVEVRVLGSGFGARRGESAGRRMRVLAFF